MKFLKNIITTALLVPVNFEGATIDDYLSIASRVEEEYSTINSLILNAASLGNLRRFHITIHWCGLEYFR